MKRPATQPSGLRWGFETASRKNLEKLKIIISSIVAKEPLDLIHRDHRLIGNWKGRRECHIESNWLLIYKSEPDRVIFERTGTHSDLFQK
ncbi:MAG: type II toxin-antitoxin system YafQ family toxin [Desulfobacteraceae bacterium]|nr:MAG: type II toxin-antitoxin system YafQ family toxin [Desulfobacteraceae bacterium]